MLPQGFEQQSDAFQKNMPAFQKKRPAETNFFAVFGLAFHES